jgi:hypothetical protein
MGPLKNPPSRLRKKGWRGLVGRDSIDAAEQKRAW